MKKGFGIILLLFGLLITNIGVGGIVNTETIKAHVVNRNINEFKSDMDIPNQIENNYQKDMVIGIAFVGIGFILFVIGIVLTASKTNKQKAIAMELTILKNLNTKVV